MMKKIVCLTTVLCAMITLYAVEAKAEKTIGILIWSNESRYTEAIEGTLAQLKKDGYGERQVKYVVENAGGSKAKASELVQKFSVTKLDMLITYGTSVTIPAVREIKNVPIIFSMVYDPVDSKIAADWKSSGNNTTGASNKVPMSQVITVLKQFAPVKHLAVLYTPGEKNSEAQLKEYVALQAKANVKVIPVPLTNKEDLAILSEVVRTVDAIFLSGSSIVGSSITLIVDAATKAKVITVTHLDDYANEGVLLGICANPYALGLQTGAKATKVLKGAKPSSLPIEVLKKFDVILNKKTAAAGKFEIRPQFMKQVTKTVE